jgi:hypothetical protein
MFRRILPAVVGVLLVLVIALSAAAYWFLGGDGVLSTGLKPLWSLRRRLPAARHIVLPAVIGGTLDACTSAAGLRST